MEKQTLPVQQSAGCQLLSQNSVEIFERLNNCKIRGVALSCHTPQQHCILVDKYSIKSLTTRPDGTIDQDRPLKLIALMIVDLLEFSAEELPLPQISNLSNTILKNYHFLKLSELKLFFERAKAGQFKFYPSISGLQLMRYLSEFADESLVLREEIAHTRHLALKGSAARDPNQSLISDTPETRAIKSELFRANFTENGK